MKVRILWEPPFLSPDPSRTEVKENVSLGQAEPGLGSVFREAVCAVDPKCSGFLSSH